MSTYRTTRPLGVTTIVVLVAAMVATVVAGCTSGSPARPGAARAAGAVGAHVVPTGATGSIDPEAWALVDRLTAPAFGTDTVDAARQALARSGIGTFADAVSSSPERPVPGSPSALRLLDFQTHALAVGVWAGSTFSGAELDTVVPSPPGSVGEPTTSQLLAGYVAAAGSPGGALSRALMAGQNLLATDTLRFPVLVLVLFASDLATDGGSRPAAPAAYRGGGQITVASRIETGTNVVARLDSGICSATQTWIDSMITSFFNSLKLATPDNLPGKILVSVWNWFVDAGQALVNGLIRTVTDTVLGTIRSIAASVAAVAEQIASFLPYAVKVTASGTGTFTLGHDPLPGTFTAQVTAGDLPQWPAVLSDCAAVAEVALPDFRAKAKPLTWGPLQAPAIALLAGTEAARTDDMTDADGRATWPFQTSTDPGDPKGDQIDQVDTMPVAVHRPELDDARERLTKALLGSIPGILRPFVGGLFAPYINGLQGRLNALLDARGTGAATLIYHGAAKPKPSAKPSSRASAACGATAGTYTGTYVNHSVETITIANGGQTVAHVDDSGPVTLIVAADGSATGTWSAHRHEVFHETVNITDFDYHRDATWTLDGTFTGSVCDLGLVSGHLQRLTCVTNHGPCGGDSQPPRQTLPTLGRPKPGAPGHLTWTWTYHSATGAVVDDVLTISVDAA